MLGSQRIDLEMREIREAINTFPDDGEKADLDKLTARYLDLESRYRAAVITEGGEQQDARPDSEVREVDRLQERAHLYDYIDEVVHDHALTGASKEFREAMLGENLAGYVPWAMLEERADAATNVATAIPRTQQTIMGRVFARSSAAFLGVSSPTVPVGTIAYPRLASGTVADVRSPGVELDGTAATLVTKSLDPIRVVASYTYGVESLSNVQGFEEALRTDLRGTLEDKRDFLALNGQAAVANVSPAAAGLLSSITVPTDPTEIATWVDYLGALDGAVDGKYAVSGDEVRLLVNPAVWKHAQGLTLADSVGVAGLLRDRLTPGRFRVSANMPASASDIGQGIVYASGASALARGIYMPVWNGVQLIDDRFTQAKAGQRVLTATMITAFDVIETAAYSRAAFKTA